MVLAGHRRDDEEEKKSRMREQKCQHKKKVSFVFNGDRMQIRADKLTINQKSISEVKWNT